LAEQYRAPYGDIVLVGTPTLDRIGQQLYLEQKQRQARQQQENAMLDANIQKEIGRVRSVDTPEVINSYNQYKQLRKELLFNKQLQKDPLAYKKLQQEANRAYQNIFSTANKSAEVKEMSKNLTTDRMKNPDVYSDDFGDRMSVLMNTPISGLNHPQLGDLTNWDNYRYKGSNTNFAEHVQKAIGQPKQVYASERVLDGGLQTEITPFTYANTPKQVKDYLLGTFGMHNIGRDASYQWRQLPEAEIEETIKQYQAIPKEKWQKMGISTPQDLLPSNADNDAENYASYLAMKYAISSEPKQGTPIYRQNLKAVKDLDYARDLEKERIRHANARDLIEYRKKIDPNDTDLNNTWIETYIGNRISAAKSDPNNLHVIYNSQSPNLNVKGYFIKPDAVMMKAFTRGAGKDAVEPDRIYVTEDNKIMPIFYKYSKDEKGNVSVAKNKAGHPLIDEDYSQPMDIDQAMLTLGYKGQTKKQLSETMSGNGAKAKHPLPAGQPRTVKQNGHIYTWSEEKGTYE